MKGRTPSLDTIAKRAAAVYSGPAPECPDWLDPAAKIEWERVAPELYRQGMLTPSDVMLLASYCQAYSQWQQAELIVRTDGMMVAGSMGNMVLHPAARHAVKLLSEVRRAAAEFGFSPASRTRVQMPPRKDEEQDDLDAFVKGG